ncbi:hypothetical protein DYI23_08675 [Roseibium polysiphoniae]|uniref:HNH endonuclease n=2 Tax=Roseibium polysiphoniae TaxID=2571221 RepID=A0A944GS17_9HYPH|nr:hypothetical protein [Roseibium polysiphoniae]
MGAKPGAARYDNKMSDVTRASITNGIWLCRNCHAQIDRDETLFPPELLFNWRKEHEDVVLRDLGTRGEQMRHDIEMSRYPFLEDCPAIIQRIALDKPIGWEWRLAAELLRYLNRPQLKRLKNLQSRLSYRPLPPVKLENLMGFVAERTNVMTNLLGPLTSILDRLTESFGPPGEAGNAEEIYDCCVLLRDILSTAIDHEEIIHFTGLPEEGEAIREILRDAMGKNLIKLSKLSDSLDNAIALIGTDHGGTSEDPHVVTYKVAFDLPDDFTANFNRELKRLERLL